MKRQEITFIAFVYKHSISRIVIMREGRSKRPCHPLRLVEVFAELPNAKVFSIPDVNKSDWVINLITSAIMFDQYKLKRLLYKIVESSLFRSPLKDTWISS